MFCRLLELMYRNAHSLALLLLAAFLAAAQTPPKTAFVGTVSSVSADQIEVAPGRRYSHRSHVTPSAAVQRIAPDEKAVKNAQTIQLSDVAKGDSCSGEFIFRP